MATDRDTIDAPMPAADRAQTVLLVFGVPTYREIMAVLRRRYGRNPNDAMLLVMAIREAVGNQLRTEG